MTKKQPIKKAAGVKAPAKQPKPQATPKRVTKQSKIIALLSQDKGVTLDELMSATGWQKHSVRGHISNLRRKNGLNINTFMRKNGEKSYRITPPDAS